jgi:hypothetical protein
VSSQQEGNSELIDGEDNGEDCPWEEHKEEVDSRVESEGTGVQR